MFDSWDGEPANLCLPSRTASPSVKSSLMRATEVSGLRQPAQDRATMKRTAMFRAFLQKLSHQTEGIRLDYQGYFTLPWLPWNMRKMTSSEPEVWRIVTSSTTRRLSRSSTVSTGTPPTPGWPTWRLTWTGSPPCMTWSTGTTMGEFSTVKNDLVTEMTQMLGLPNTKKVIKKWNPSVSMTVKRCQIP